MARAKKTVSIEEIKKLFNKQLAQKGENLVSSPKVRKELALLLTDILFKTNNYHGFNYVEWIDEGGCEQWRKDGEPKDNTKYLGDQTRVRFY